MKKNGNIAAIETIKEMQTNGEWRKLNGKLIEENYINPINDLDYEKGNVKLASYLDEARYDTAVQIYHERYMEAGSQDDEKMYREVLTEVLLNTDIIYLKNGEKILDDYLSEYFLKTKDISLKPRTIKLIRRMMATYPDKVIDLMISGKISFNKANKELPLAMGLGKTSPLYNMSEEELIVYFNEVVM